MSISGPAEVSARDLGLPVAIAVSVGLAVALRLYRANRSPMRAPAIAEVAPASLFTIAVVTFMLWIGVPAIYGAVITWRASEPTTRPTQFSPSELAGLSLVAPAIGIAAILTLSRRSDERLPALLGFGRSAWWRGSFEGLVGSIIVVPVTFGVAFLTQAIYSWLKYQHPLLHPLLDTLGKSASPWLTGVIVVSAIIVGPVFEELFFRGLLQTALAAGMSRAGWSGKPAVVIAVVVSSVLFTLVHGQLWMMPPIYFLSLCLGLSYERAGNLWTPIVIHACFNAVSTTQFLASR